MLTIFSGLPGCGKSTLARALSAHTGAVYLRIDTIEQALWDLCALKVEGEGYGLSYRVAADNLSLGNSAIADSVNPVRLTRDEWNAVATESGARYQNIEVVCSDPDEHRRRVEQRRCAVPGLALPTWQDVQNRDYEPWHMDRLVIDTAGKTVEASCRELLDLLELKS